MKNIILDTNAYSSFQRKDRIEAIEIVESALSLALTPIVLGELGFGFIKGR